MSLRENGGSFDLDLRHGKVGEWLTEALLRDHLRTVEVKREDSAYKYKSLYVETEHDPGAHGLYRPSGLSISTASYWAFVMGATVILVPTEWLRDRSSVSLKVVQSQPPVPTKGFRLKIEDFLRFPTRIEPQLAQQLGMFTDVDFRA